MAEKILEKPLSDKIKTDNSKKKIKNTDKAIISTENSVEETPPQPAPPAPAPARGNLSIFKLVFYYWIISQVIGFFFKSSPTGPQPGLYSNIFLMDEPLEVFFELSKVPHFSSNKSNKIMTWSEKDIFYNYNQENFREKIIFLNKTKVEDNKIEHLKNIYVNVFVTSIRDKKTINETGLIPFLILNGSYNLIENRAKKIEEESVNLFEEKEDSQIKAKENQTEKVPHLRNKTYVNLIHDTNYYTKAQIPPQFNITLIDAYNVYQPVLDTSQFWLQKKDYICLDGNATEAINISISFNIYWSWKFIMETQMQASTKMYTELGMESNIEDMKDMFLETNVYLLSLTMVVSLLHSFFEILVMKNEIQFWQNAQSHRGLSLRSLYFIFFVGIVQFFYLLDNETSSMILIFSFLEILLSAWKIMKTTKFKRRADKKFPWFEFDHLDSYKSETEQYDKVATTFLLKIMSPFLIAYFVYSLIYDKHKGWYSFILSSLMGFIYMFGFIEMTPQIYINYKMKTVTHLPWRSLIYRFLNTIIDDLFAFIITMPWLKRLSCFRDDVIFVIYLYQRWIYRVDPNRNEYGELLKKENEIKEGETAQKEIEGLLKDKVE